MAETTLYALSEQDRDTLAEVIGWWQRTRGADAYAQPRKRLFRTGLWQCSGTLSAVLSSTSTSASVDHVTALAGASPTTASTAPLTVANPYRLAGADNAACRLYYNPLSSGWAIDQVQHAKQTIQLDYDVNGKLLRKKQLVVAAMGGTTATTWITVHTGTTCP